MHPLRYINRFHRMSGMIPKKDRAVYSPQYLSKRLEDRKDEIVDLYKHHSLEEVLNRITTPEFRPR